METTAEDSNKENYMNAKRERFEKETILTPIIIV